MNTDNGALSFDAYINNSQFKQDIDEMQRKIRGLSDTAVNESKKIENSFAGIGAVAAGYFGTQALTEFARQVVNVRGEFQQLGMAFEVMLGSKEKADALMAEQVAFAQKTPYTLTEVATNTKQLMAMGVATEDVMATMKSLGDVAAGVSVPISRVAINYGQVMTLGKLQGREIRDFAMAGIPIIGELAIMLGKTKDEILEMSEAGKITADMTTEAFRRMSAEGGKFYNMMERQTASVTGQLSNLQDKVSVMLNNIGTANEGLIYSIISGSATAVEHYQDILDVILPLVAVYGAYKAALLLTAAAQKAVALSTFVQEYVVMARALGTATANQIAFNRAVLANPYAIAAAAIAGLVVVIYELSRSEDNLIKVREKASDQYDEQKDKITALKSVLDNEKISIDERRKALVELQGIIPAYHAQLTNEGKLINENKVAIDEYLKSLEKQIYLTAIMDEKIELTKKKRLQQKEVDKREKNAEQQSNAAKANVGNVGGSSFGAGSGADMLSGQAKIMAENARKELKATTEALDELDKEYIKFSNTVKSNPVDPAKPRETEEEKKKRLAREKKEAEERKKNLKDFNDEALELQKKAYQAELELARTNAKDKKALIDLDLQNTLYEIKEQEKIYKEKAKIAGIKNPDMSVFGRLRATAQNQADSEKRIVDQDEAKKQKEKLDGYLEKFRTFQGQLVDIERRYHEDSLLLNKAYLKSKSSAEEAQIQDSIKARNEAYEKEKSDVKVKELMASPDWTLLFSDLSKVSVDEMIKLRDKIEAQFSSMKLDPKDLESLRNKLREVTNEVLNRNPFKALSEAMKKYKADQSASNFTDLFKAISGSADATKNIFDQLVGSLDKLGIKTDQETDQVLKDVSGMIGGASNLAMGIATGNPMAIIQGSIDLITNGIDLIAGSGDRKLNKSIRQHQEEVVKLKEAYDDLQRAIDKALGSDRYSTQKATIDNLKKQQAEYAAMARDESAKKKSDDAKVKEYQNSIKSNTLLIEDTINKLREEILTTDVSSVANDLGDALISAFSAGEDAAKAWGAKVDDIVGNVMRKMLVQKLVEEPVGKILNKYMAQWVDSSGNFLGFDAVMKSAQAMGSELNSLGTGMSAALSTLPDEIKKYFIGDTKAGSTSPMTGAVQSVSQETASVISGQLNAIRINQSENTEVMRNQLLSLNRIAQNTAYNINLLKLTEMLDVLKTISNNNTLRSQGL
jgi:tape measure domain-containing protein